MKLFDRILGDTGCSLKKAEGNLSLRGEDEAFDSVGELAELLRVLTLSLPLNVGDV